MTKLYLDTETMSEIPVTRGVSAYVTGKFFAVIMVQYAIDDGEVKIWEPQYDKIPDDLSAAVESNPVYVIHNSVFDRCVLNKSGLLGRTIEPDRIIDTMVQAYAHGFPGGLGQLSAIFGLPEDKAKDKRGKQLINLFCCPQPRRQDIFFHTKETRPDDWKVFREYGLKDVEAMRYIHKRLPTINYPKLEHHIWVYDQRINDRGIPVDVEFAEAAVREADIERHKLNAKTAKATRGEVDAATKRDKLIEFIAKDYGMSFKTLRAKDVQTMADDENLPPGVRELMSLRVQSSMNSTAKYKRILEHQTDGRMRYTLQMYGATRTGRDAGRVMQPQNLRRPTLWKDVPDVGEAIDEDVELVISGDIPLVYDNVMLVLSDLVRSVICAPEGKKLVAADLSNIEGRGLAYLAGEDWKIQYFRDFDAGKIKFDNYKMAYAKAMNIRPEDVTKEGRQIGKVQELGLGYEGGVRAFLTFAAVYNLNIAEMADAVWASGDIGMLNECKRKYKWAKENGHHAGLNEIEYSACEYLKQLWRNSHPKTVQFWNELDMAYRNAITNPGVKFPVGKLTFLKDGSFLYIRLPSGRCLCYLNPGVNEQNNLTFQGVSQYTKQFETIKTYSGKLAENVTSAFARDILFHRIPMIEDAGYAIVSRVHDELVCETPDDEKYSATQLAAMMATPHLWCPDMPLAAAGFEAHRYRKD